MKKVFQTFLRNPLLVVLGRLVMLLGRLQGLLKRGGVLGRRMFSLREWRERERDRVNLHGGCVTLPSFVCSTGGTGKKYRRGMQQEADERDSVLL